MNQHFISLSGLFLAVSFLTGCVANEPPQSSLSTNAAVTAPIVATDLAEVFAELPQEGPAPLDRPDILSLASSSTSIVPMSDAPAKQDVLQAMVEPVSPLQVPEPEDTMEQPAQPIIASNRERNCLMRTMYFESNRSSPDGLLAVGTVVMHRLENGTWGNSVCSVVSARNQFAPGLMTRSMQGDLSDLQALADQILAGKRHPKLAKNVMFFHVAGMKFPYKNMRYVHVAGGNTFYYKAQRTRRG